MAQLVSTQSKYTDYQQLILRVQSAYPVYQDSVVYDKNQLVWCDACKKEINLWSYWQGSLDAKIMLVGQDWGCPFDKSFSSTMAEIQKANNGEAYNYLFNTSSPTDKNLVTLFSKALNKDITKPDNDLFFTNFVLGYRTHGTSGSFQKVWAAHDCRYFKELVEIIQPKVILCLGKATFREVLASLAPDLKPRIGMYNRYIEGKRNPVAITMSSGNCVSGFALAHCGVMGTLNRNRKENLSLDQQIEDWKKVLCYL